MSEEEKQNVLVTAGNELRDVEQTLMKHIAMELRDEDPHQFVNAYTAGLVLSYITVGFVPNAVSFDFTVSFFKY